MTTNVILDEGEVADKVSVVLCTYNGSEFIIPQLESILKQTYPLFEILVFDDASTDDTADKIRSYALGNPIVQLTVNSKNIGFTKNFEQAIQGAKGNIIAISDQDDIWLPEKIEKMLAVWNRKHPLIYCNSFVFEHNIPTSFRNPKNKMFSGEDGRKLLMVNSISGHSALIQKSFLPLIIPFPKKAIYDWWMGIVAAYNGGVQHLDEVLVFQRKHSNNITVRVLDNLLPGEKELFIKQQVIDYIDDFMNAPNMPVSHQQFGAIFLRLMKESLYKQFHFPLFLFIVKNRKLLLHYKSKPFSIFSRIKHSYIRARTLAYRRAI